MAGVDLLNAGTTHDGIGRHVDPGAGTVAAGEPRTLTARDLAAAVELGRRLAEVPHVPGAVLRVPVGRALGEASPEVEAVVDGRRTDPFDRPRPSLHPH